MNSLCFPAWVPVQLLKRIFDILAEYGESRLVGGCVRDIIISIISQDFDIATTVHPEKVQMLLTENGIKAIPTGIKHGTITAIVDKYNFEITTLRKDVECDGRHAEVYFTNNWKADASRRDFTINAISMDLSGNIYDYFEGINDLHNRIIRFIGEPVLRINEDRLRILRYFRFYSYFGGNNFDIGSLNAAIEYASKIEALSGERIKKEILKLLENKYALATIILMVERGIWEHLKCSNPDLNKLYTYNFSDNGLINLSAILRATNSPELNIENIRARWKLSNKELKFIKLLCFKEHDPNTTDITNSKRAFYFLGKEMFMMKLKLLAVEKPFLNLRGLYFIAATEFPKFPLDGKDIKKAGFKGKAIGEIIQYATNAWINSDFRLKKEELLEMIKDNIFLKLK